MHINYIPQHTYVMHNFWGDLHIIANCPIDDNILFTETNFTISNGNRTCFDVIIIDDDVIDYTKHIWLYVCLQNRTYHDHFYDRTHIIVIDNEGWFLLVLNHCLNLPIDAYEKLAGAHTLMVLCVH